MANLESALKQLKVERDQAEHQLETLDNAISAIEGIIGRGVISGRNGRRSGRIVTAAARQRMAQAQRARWARVREKSGVSGQASGPGKRPPLSVAARRKIAAAQRARWARFRASNQKAAA